MCYPSPSRKSAVLYILVTVEANITNQAIQTFLASNEMSELRKYELGASEWDALIAFQKILQVNNIHVISQSTSQTLTIFS